MQQVSRRHFILSSAAIGASASVGLSTSVLASTDLASDYPIPTAAPANFVEFSNSIIPDDNAKDWFFSWEFAEDPHFSNVVNRDSVRYTNNGEDLITVRLENVPNGKRLYYRSACENCYVQEHQSEYLELEARKFVVFPIREITKVAGADHIEPVVERTY